VADIESVAPFELFQDQLWRTHEEIRGVWRRSKDPRGYQPAFRIAPDWP
jgi:hypothetical protein